MITEMATTEVFIRSDKHLPAWALPHYMSTTESTYRKLFTIFRIMDLISSGVYDDQLVVGESSSDIYIENEISFSEIKRYFSPSLKYENPFVFWDKITRLSRPQAFWNDNGTFKPIYQPNGGEGFRVFHASVQSPIELGWSGVDEIIHEFRFGHLREAREQEIHERRLRELDLLDMEGRVDLVNKVMQSNLTPEMKDAVVKRIMEIVLRQRSNDDRVGACLVYTNRGRLIDLKS